MTKRPYDNSLMTQYLEGRIDRRELMRRAGTLAAFATTAGAAGGVFMPHPALASAAAQDNGGLLTTNNEQTSTWIRNFNPLLPENASCRWPTLFGIYEPLFVWNTIKGVAEPMLAESWAFSDDNMSVTFTLRSGVAWSDGTPFTAKDVVFTWELFRQFEGLSGTGARNVLADIDSIVASTGEVSGAI